MRYLQFMESLSLHIHKKKPQAINKEQNVTLCRFMVSKNTKKSLRDISNPSIPLIQSYQLNNSPG